MPRGVYDEQSRDLDFYMELVEKGPTELLYGLRWKIAGSDMLGLGSFNGTSPQLHGAEPLFLLSCQAKLSCLSQRAPARQLSVALEASDLPLCHSPFLDLGLSDLGSLLRTWRTNPPRNPSQSETPMHTTYERFFSISNCPLCTDYSDLWKTRVMVRSDLCVYLPLSFFP